MPNRSGEPSFERLVRDLDLRNRDNLSARVFWIGKLRAQVEKRMPRNKAGAPVMSDVDVMLATPDELRQAFDETIGAITSGKIVSTRQLNLEELTRDPAASGQSDSNDRQ